MASYQVTSGVIQTAQKVVLYGVEGIGKTTFAAQFPDPVFIDTEGGSGRLNVDRLPAPSSWSMLLDEVEAVRKGQVPCKTLVIDTADWAERLCIQSICDKAHVNGLEGFGYGKGYTYLKEAFAGLLDKLEEVKGAGIHVVLTAHAQITKFELPDEMGAFDRWSLKVSKQVAPLLREWCDMLLFANFKTLVVRDDATGKGKAQGDKRVMYTTHHACWDAKNRDGLPAELPLDFACIAYLFGKDAGARAQLPIAALSAPVVPEPAKPYQTTPSPQTPTQGAAEPAQQAADPAQMGWSEVTPMMSKPETKQELLGMGVPEPLAELMVANHVASSEIIDAVACRGYFPAGMPIKDYPKDFVDGVLIGAWSQVYSIIQENREDLPF